MGRKAKLRALQRIESLKGPVVRLSGEQAEAFDDQMTYDRKWFERNPAMILFRPQFPGEWAGYELTGSQPPLIGPAAYGDEWTALASKKFQFNQELPTPGFVASECTWTAVVDIGRLVMSNKQGRLAPPSGIRLRMASVPVTSEEDQRAATKLVCEAALAFFTQSGKFEEYMAGGKSGSFYRSRINDPA